MNAQLSSATLPSDDGIGCFSEVVARLVEAASLVREGYSEAAKAHVARALALLRGNRSSISENVPPLNRGAGKSSTAASPPGRSGD